MISIRTHAPEGSPLTGLLRPLTSLLLAVMATLATTACASGGGSGDGLTGERFRVTLLDHRSGAHFELVSESFTDRVTYYSQPRTDPYRKFQTDQAMEALVDEMNSDGYEKYSKPGRAARSGNTLLTSSIEVDHNGTTTHWTVAKGTDQGQLRDFLTCKIELFMQLYQVTAGYQAYDGADRSAPFKVER